MNSEETFLAGRLAGILECAAAIQMGQSATAATKSLIGQKKAEASFRVWAQSKIQQLLKEQQTATMRADVRPIYAPLSGAQIIPLSHAAQIPLPNKSK